MKKLFRSSSIFIIAVLVFSIVLAGCGGSPDTSGKSTSAETAASTAQVTTTVANNSVTWDIKKKDRVVISVINNYYTAGEKQLAEDYMKLHPETEVIVDVVADNDTYIANLKTKYTTDKNLAPDIIHSDFAVAVLGTWASVFDKGYILDIGTIKDEINPYNENKKLSEACSEADINLATSMGQGRLGFIPFDRVGVGVYYNKTIFDKLGLNPPASMEDWLSTCKKLKDAGYSVPVAASFTAEWVVGMYADIAYRSLVPQLLSLPGDGVYDPATMQKNTTIKYDINDPLFDQYAILNSEKMNTYVKNNGYNTPINKQIWKTFGEIGQYFQKNWASPDDAKVVTDFETQSSPMMIHGSWNVGKIQDDILKLPKDKQFDWGTFKVPGYTNPPAGFEAKIRSLYVFGNCIGIVPKDDKDHMERVKDVYKYWMSPKVAQMMYDVTLANGNYVQGPSAILGVTLSEENTRKLDGFKADGNMLSPLGSFTGQAAYIPSDKPLYNEILNKLTDNKIDVDTFMVELNKIAMKRFEQDTTKAGVDFNPVTKDTPKE